MTYKGITNQSPLREHKSQMEYKQKLIQYIPLTLSPKSPRMLDKLEVLAEVTERPRFLPWEFNITSNDYIAGNGSF